MFGNYSETPAGGSVVINTLMSYAAVLIARLDGHPVLSK